MGSIPVRVTKRRHSSAGQSARLTRERSQVRAPLSPPKKTSAFCRCLFSFPPVGRSTLRHFNTRVGKAPILRKPSLCSELALHSRRGPNRSYYAVASSLVFGCGLLLACASFCHIGNYKKYKLIDWPVMSKIYLI